MWNLNKHNHEYYKIPQYNQNPSKTVRLIHIPHFQMGQFGPFGVFKLLIFFPRMYSYMNDYRARNVIRNNFISNIYIALWYNRVFMPALVKKYSKDIVQHFPPSFESCQLLFKKKNGRDIYPTIGLPAAYLEALNEELRKLVQDGGGDLEKFGNFFFH